MAETMIKAEKLNKSNLYTFSFMQTLYDAFDEDKVSICDGDLVEGALDEYKETLKFKLKNVGDSFKIIEVDEGLWIDYFQGETLEPIEMAERLIVKYKDYGSFYLKKDEFKRLSNKNKLRDEFIKKVDIILRDKGYFLIDLIKEKDLIAISNIDSIMKWEDLS